jgi:hypothetical protein
MVAFFQYRPSWTIPGAGPSQTVIAGQSVLAQDFADNVRAFFSAMNGILPNDVTVGFPPEVLSVEAEDGELQDVIPVTAPANVPGLAAGGWAGGAGCVVRWETGEVMNGRRIRGRTFLVPLASLAFDTDGTLVTATRTAITAAGTALISAMAADGGQLLVWSRPAPEADPPRLGSLQAVTNAFVPDRSAILRERRD